MTLDDVATIALALPEVTESDRRGQRVWSVAGKTFAWERAFSKADIKRFGDVTPPSGEIVAIRVADLSEKEAVLAADYKGFFTIPHFDCFSAVLVELRKATRKRLGDAIFDGWLACAPPKLTDQF